MNAIEPSRRPQLAHELRAEADRLIRGPVRLPGATAEAPGMIVEPDPAWHPGAAEAAARLRAAYDQPADRDTVQQWLELLAASVASPPTSAKEFDKRLSAIMFLCGDLPAECWGPETLRKAQATFKFWPSVAEIWELLKPHADRLAAEIDAFDRMANADPRGVRGAREAAIPYKLPPPPPERSALPSKQDIGDPDYDPAADLVRIDPLRVKAQLAVLGFEATDGGALQPIEPIQTPAVQSYLAKGQPNARTKSVGAAVRRAVDDLQPVGD